MDVLFAEFEGSALIHLDGLSLSIATANSEVEGAVPQRESSWPVSRYRNRMSIANTLVSLSSRSMFFVFSGRGCFHIH